MVIGGRRGGWRGEEKGRWDIVRGEKGMIEGGERREGENEGGGE